MAASHSNGPISSRIASRVLFQSTTSFQLLYIPGSPFQPLRASIGRPAARLLPNFSPFARRLGKRSERVEHRGPSALTSRVEARRFGAARGRRLRAGIKRPQCARGRLSAAGTGVVCVCGRCAQWASEAAGSRAEPPGPSQGRSGSSWAPRPGRRLRERKKGAGGTRPRPTAVMVSAAARPGRGGGRPLGGVGGVSGACRGWSGALEGPPGGPGIGMGPQAFL